MRARVAPGRDIFLGSQRREGVKLAQVGGFAAADEALVGATLAPALVALSAVVPGFGSDFASGLDSDFESDFDSADEDSVRFLGVEYRSEYQPPPFRIKPDPPEI